MTEPLVVDKRGFTIEGHRFLYNLYFLEDCSEFAAPTSATTFKKILNKWAESLTEMDEGSEPLYLPFAPDDQWTDCLRAALVGEEISLNFVRVADNGWGVFDFDLKGFNNSPHVVKIESPIFGKDRKGELISALLNAAAIDD